MDPSWTWNLSISNVYFCRLLLQIWLFHHFVSQINFLWCRMSTYELLGKLLQAHRKCYGQVRHIILAMIQLFPRIDVLCRFFHHEELTLNNRQASQDFFKIINLQYLLSLFNHYRSTDIYLCYLLWFNCRVHIIFMRFDLTAQFILFLYLNKPCYPSQPKCFSTKDVLPSIK